MDSRVLVVGCGDVGTALGRRLAAEGVRVFGLRRDPAGLPPCITPVAADVTDPSRLELVPEHLDCVVYAVSAGARDEAAYRAAYVDGVRNVLGLLQGRHASPRRLIFASSTAVYAQQRGEWVDEESPVSASGFAARCLLEGEDLVLASGLPAVVVRFGGIYGPQRTWLIERVRRGEPCVARPPRWTNRIHRDDCAGVLAHLLRLSDARGVYLAVDCEPATECTVFAWIAHRLGLPAPTRIAAGAAPGGGRGGSKRCRNARLLASGYTFRYPSFRAGYAAILEQQGCLPPGI